MARARFRVLVLALALLALRLGGSVFAVGRPPWTATSARPAPAAPPSARQALPEASLLLADLQPTPGAVSSAFNVITFLPQYLWLLMVLAPNWSVTRKVMAPLWPALLFCAVHLFIVVNVASTNSDNLSEFTLLAQVFDPRVSPGARWTSRLAWLFFESLELDAEAAMRRLAVLLALAGVLAALSLGRHVLKNGRPNWQGLLAGGGVAAAAGAAPAPPLDLAEGSEGAAGGEGGSPGSFAAESPGGADAELPNLPPPALPAGRGSGLMWLGQTKELSQEELQKMVTPPEVPRPSRSHDFVLCANIAGTLGSALQALKAFLTIARRLQERGWRVRVVFPALGTHEFDDLPLSTRNGTSLANMLDTTPLRQLLDIEEEADVVFERRQQVCWEQGCDVSVWSLVQVHTPQLRNLTVPHLWIGPGLEKWMFEQLFDNLATLGNAAEFPAPIRVFWQMQSYSPAMCGPFVYPALAKQVDAALVPKAQEESCAFVYVRRIIRRDKMWHLPGPFSLNMDVQAPVSAVAQRIAQVLKEHRVPCANFYVKLLGLNSTGFLSLVRLGFGAAASARRVRKRNCRLCTAGNMEILQKAASAPLLLAEKGSFWPDVPAARLLALGKPVAYLSGVQLPKRKVKVPNAVKAERFAEPEANVSVTRLACEGGLVYRGRCVRPGEDPNQGSVYECWPED
ncbi:unnamed protein product [Effrenium voratum]|uniref:Uncharacterized protein n=1 Tax=Effrenium voratum TaxID=2562239 RepID=A0AA36J6L2_9DINO|nr:unnamed protein product [Effrenium voratum]